MRVIIKLNPNDLMGEIGFGMDFYLEFFKFSPQIKISAGILNLLDKDQTVYTTSIKNLYTNGWMLSFTFEEKIKNKLSQNNTFISFFVVFFRFVI